MQDIVHSLAKGSSFFVMRENFTYNVYIIYSLSGVLKSSNMYKCFMNTKYLYTCSKKIWQNWRHKKANYYRVQYIKVIRIQIDDPHYRLKIKIWGGGGGSTQRRSLYVSSSASYSSC